MATPPNVQATIVNHIVANWFREYFISHSSGEGGMKTMSRGFAQGFPGVFNNTP